MTTAPAQLRNTERIPRWNMRLTLLLLLSLFCLAFVLFSPMIVSGEYMRQLPVGLHSVLRSDYSASQIRVSVGGVGLGLIESALKDQVTANNAPERMATVVRNLDEIVPTVTPIGGFILSPTAPVLSPTPTRKATTPSQSGQTQEPTATRHVEATTTALPTKTWAPTKTSVPPTSAPPTAVPPTAVPPTAVPPTAVPPTPVPTSPPPPTPVPTNPPSYPPPPAPTSPPPAPTDPPPAPTSPPPAYP